MRRFYPALKYALLTLFIPLLVAAFFGSCMSGVIFKGSSCSVQDGVLMSLKAYGPWVFSAFLLLLVPTLFARRDHLRHSASQQFALVKSAELLRPEDMGFEPAVRGGAVGHGRRPFHEAYVPTKAMPEPPDGTGPRSCDEEALADEARSGRGFVLLGQPLDGKSRTLYQVLSGLKGCRIVAPSLSRGLPDDDALSLVEGEDVILLLEDLHEYVGARVVLPELHAALTKRASSCAVVATCRDGPS